MRSFIVMAMFAGPLVYAGWTDYEEQRELTLDASGVSQLTVHSGPGSMDVTGIDGGREISVIATIIVPNANEEKAQKIIAKRMKLSLDRDASDAVLIADFANGFLSGNSNAHIVLDVRIPQGMKLDIDDGSGSIEIIDTAGDVMINDGSGSIDIRNVANLRVDDGSGSIKVKVASGDVWIEDGSGSIRIEAVQGSVTIDDGSGSIRVSDVEHDLTIVDDGSGGVSIVDVRGRVNQET